MTGADALVDEPAALRTARSSSTVAPVAVFAYKRLRHLEQTIASLRRNPQAAQAALYVFCDGARTVEDRAAVAAVRDYVMRLDGFGSVTPVLRESNFGLSRSIIDGVTQVLQRHDRVVVVEDDLLLSPHFLRYMNDGLALYAEDEAVASIHGYCYPVREPLPETFFLKGADCWGWATWRRAWRHFEPDGAKLLASLRERGLTRPFDLDGSYPYTAMLEDQVHGCNDSWAIRWHASCFLAGMLTLYPGASLVHNTGNDGSGTHSGSTKALDQQTAQRPVEVKRIALEESAAGRAAVVSFLRGQRALRLRRWLGAPLRWLQRRAR